MKELTAICIPGSTFSIKLIKASALYFDRIYVLDPLPDVGAVNVQIREIDDKLNSIDWDYITDVAKDNVPFWVTAGLSCDLAALISTFTVSFILTGISSIKYLKNREYTETENQKNMLLDRKKDWSDIEHLADHGIVESLAPSLMTKYSSISLTETHTNILPEHLNLSDLAGMYPDRKNVDLPNALIDLKQQVALLIEAYERNSVIVTDNPSLNRVLSSLMSSFHKNKEHSIAVTDLMNDIINRGVKGLNAFISVLPELSEVSTQSILELRSKHEHSLRHLRQEVIQVSESDSLQESMHRAKEIEAAVRHVEESLRWDLRKIPRISYGFYGALDPTNTIFWRKK